MTAVTGFPPTYVVLKGGGGPRFDSEGVCGGDRGWPLGGIPSEIYVVLLRGPLVSDHFPSKRSLKRSLSML